MGRIKSYVSKRRWAKKQKTRGVSRVRHHCIGPFLLKLGIGILAVTVILPPIGDRINGFVKEVDGCRILRVVDGDTIKIQCSNGTFSARILAYDTPELNARCPSELLNAIAATQYLRWQLWTAKKISVKIDGIDRYRRKLVILLVDGEGIAKRMVEANLGRWYDGSKRASWCTAPT